MIVLPDDDLKRLERCLGPDVWEMGTWNSDGVFGFCTVPVIVVQKAAEAVGHPELPGAVDRLKKSENRTQPFIDLVQAFGPPFVHQIAASYREHVAEVYIRPRTRGASGSA